MNNSTIPFLSKNLDHRILPVSAAPPVLFFVGDRPYYRLTPRVWHHYARTIHKAWYHAANDQQRRRTWDAAPVLFHFLPWVEANYTPEEMRVGVATSKTLPVDPDYRAVEAPRHEGQLPS